MACRQHLENSCSRLRNTEMEGKCKKASIREFEAQMPPIPSNMEQRVMGEPLRQKGGLKGECRSCCIVRHGGRAFC